MTSMDRDPKTGKLRFQRNVTIPIEFASECFREAVIDMRVSICEVGGVLALREIASAIRYRLKEAKREAEKLPGLATDNEVKT